MNFKYEQELKELLTPLFNELELKPCDDDIYLKDDFAVKLDYDEEKQLVVLKAAKPQEGESLQFITLSEYLFDSGSSERDLKAVAIDFEETLRSELGVKRAKGTSKIALPTRAAQGETPTIEAFTKVFLDMCPKNRDDYRLMMEVNGSFLYVEFYKKFGVQRMKELAHGGAKTEKQLGKFLNFLNKYFLEGDRYVIATITTVIMAGAFYNDRETFETVIKPRISEDKYFLSAAEASIDYAAKHKKLQAVLS